MIGSADDDDDLQIKTKSGTFTAGKGIHTGRGHDSFALTYEFKDSSSFNAGSDKGSTGGSKADKGSGNKKKTEIFKTFMNQFAISPVPPSNVAGSDNAGKSYTLEWEEEIPWDGEYVFNVQADNEAHLYIDNDMVGEKIILGSGGAAGATLSPPQKIKKFMSAGVRKITLDLINLPVKEMKKIQEDVVPTSDEVTFTIKTASLFASGFEIEDLGIVIPHQANFRITTAVQERLGVDENKVFSNIHKYGNTTAASVGIALSEALEQNKINDNDIVVLVAFGAGFYWSSVVIRW